MTSISAYVLTNNSEKYLAQILVQLARIAEDIVVLDSGSQDATEAICADFSTVRFLHRPLDDFKSQRNYAAAQCRYDWILFVASDEIPDADFVQSVRQLKTAGFDCDTYTVSRHWYVLGQPIVNMYPIVSPDRPIRLFDRRVASFTQDSNRVHESLRGGQREGKIGGKLFHHTMETKAEIQRKLEHYTDIAALDLLDQDKPLARWRMYLSPIGAFCKWYGIRRGYRDGRLGLYLGKYAFDYTYKKYQKARALNRRRKKMPDENSE